MKALSHSLLTSHAVEFCTNTSLYPLRIRTSVLARYPSSHPLLAEDYFSQPQLQPGKGRFYPEGLPNLEYHGCCVNTITGDPVHQQRRPLRRDRRYDGPGYRRYTYCPRNLGSEVCRV